VYYCRPSSSDSCSDSYLALYSGSSEDQRYLLGKLCGSWSRLSYWTRHKYGYIKFHTGSADNVGNYTGFSRIDYQAVGILTTYYLFFKVLYLLCVIPDVNECLSFPSPCDHKCTNLEGSYKCTCRDGFYLDRNNRTCLGSTAVCI